MSIDTKKLYQTETIKALQNFSVSGVSFSVDLAKNIALIKKEVAIVNMELGYLDKKISQAIVKASDEMIAGHWNQQIVVDQIQGGAGTSMNMNVNEIIATRATEILKNVVVAHPLEHVNKTQSTNDVAPTALRITILQKIDHLLIILREYQAELKKKGQEFKTVMKVGRTHLQDAVPVSLGREFLAQTSAMGEDIKRLKQAQNSLLNINLGGTAIGTMANSSPIFTNLVVKRLAQVTNYKLKSAPDLVYATQYVDDFTTVSAVLAILSTNLVKFLNDLRLMASGPRAGWGEISFAELQKGSTIMPGKVNPVAAEMLTQIAFQVLGNNQTILLAAQAGQFELNVMLPVITKNILESLRFLDKGLGLFTKYGLKTLRANRERCQQLLNDSLVGATALSKVIGYERTEKILKKASAGQKSLMEIVATEKIMSQKDFEKLLKE